MALGSEAAIAIVIKARDEAAKVIGDVEQKASGLGKTLGSVTKIAAGVAIGAGISEGARFLVDATKAAAEDQAAQERLSQAVRNLGGDYDSQIAAVNKAVASGQKLGFTDDDMRDSFVRLSASTGDSEEALQRQKAALDLARGAGIPLSQASLLLGKITDDNVEVFKRMGITIGDNATEADALAAVQAKFGGQAQTYASSTAGQFEITKQQMGELKEQIGTALLPVMTILGGILVNNVIPAVTSLLNVMTANPAVFAAAAAVIGGVLVVAFIAWAVAAAGAAVATIAAMAPILAVIAVIALLAAGIILLVKNWDAVRGAIVAFIQQHTLLVAALALVLGPIGAIIAIGILLIAHWDAVKAAAQALGDLVVSIANAIRDGVVAAWTAIQDGVTAAAQATWDFVTGAWNATRDAVGGAADGARDWVVGTWNDLSSTVQGIAGGLRDAVVGVFNEFSGTLGGIVDGIRDRIVSAFEGMVSTVKGLVNGLVAGVNGVINAINGALDFSVSIPGVNLPGPLPDIPGTSFSFDAPNIGTIPTLAGGGIVRHRPGGTLALLAEGGRDEAVIPLDGKHGGGTINVYGNYQQVFPNAKSSDDFMRGVDWGAA